MDEATKKEWRRALAQHAGQDHAQSDTLDELFAALEQSTHEDRGHPGAPWHAGAFAEIDALISRDHLSIKAACARVEQTYIAKYNVQAGTLRDLYVRNSRQRLARQVGTALSAGDMTTAKTLYEQLLRREKQTRNYRERSTP